MALAQEENWRIFIAVPVPDELIRQLSSLINQLKRLNGDVKWVRPETIHLTLKFLGNVPVSRLEEVFSGVAVASAGTGPFELVAEQLGVFPSQSQPRVFWVGFGDQGLQDLVRLQNRIEQTMARLGFPEEKRPFTPHLTLGRVRSLKHVKPLVQAFSGLRFGPMTLPVNRVQVMRSQLRPEGARYTVLRVVELSG